MFREGIIHPIIMTVSVYLMMALLPRNQQHKVVFAFSMLYLSGSHIYRMITNFGGWDMDITTYTMILTAKLSALGFCYKDGGVADESKLLPEQIERRVKDLPSVMEMAGYVWFPSACICGPFFEFADYKLYIEQKGRYADIPFSLIPAMVKFLKGKGKQKHSKMT